MTRKVTAKEAAQRLGIPAARIERLARAGTFPGAVRMAGVWVIPVRELKRAKLRSGAKPRPIPLPVIQDESSRFWCTKLHGELCAADCIMRQQRSDPAIAERAPRTATRAPGVPARGSTDNRGRAPWFVSCRTDRCAKGRAIRERLGDQRIRERYRGAPDARMLPLQIQAMIRLSTMGLLDEVPTIDSQPDDLAEHLL